ncbi:MAG: type III-B CRISPR module RAMP protein Cmr6 [Candidatus Diapherotrites archaeon]|nr:type III-B CRISPR module RAMP protein Cmr6 [Candidatus Diapherotrites archaeon]
MLNPETHPHVGLWLDKFLPKQESQGGEGAYGEFFGEAANIAISSDYRSFFNAWKQALEKDGVITKEAKALGRLAIGLGAESVLETNITIHRTYGVPYIPGSALKGLAARYARLRLGDEWKVDGEAYQTLFGDTSTGGSVIFFDALYVPGSAKNNKPLLIDVITVHHPAYYQGAGSPPADWDSPTPVPFLSVTGSFLVALYGPDEWVNAAFQILALALREEGIGAKTNSGYGRMRIADFSRDSSPQTLSPTVAHIPTEKKPSRQWIWRKGTISSDGKYVIDREDRSKKYRFHQRHVLPKSYTPGRKQEVEYAVQEDSEGHVVVWVKKKYHMLKE